MSRIDKLRVLDLEELLDRAERDWLIERKIDFQYQVRKKSGVADFYERLENELREQKLVTVTEYRTTKEGWVKISRPSLLQLNLESLLSARPHLTSIEREFIKWRTEFAELHAEVAIRAAYKDLTCDIALSRSCFEVLNYLIHHRDEVRGLLPRQVQHSNSTKLIGREPLLLRLFGIWRGESTPYWQSFFSYFELADKPVEFRFFAPKCMWQNTNLSHFHGILAADWASDYKFLCLSGTLIVENLETFHAEAAKSHDRLIIWGSGWKAATLRSLHELFPRPVLYWGDIDKEGYEIYGFLKNFIPDIESTLMDRSTIDRHLALATRREPFLGPFRSAADLQAEYQEIALNGLCIEQEKIHDRPY